MNAELPDETKAGGAPVRCQRAAAQEGLFFIINKYFIQALFFKILHINKNIHQLSSAAGMTDIISSNSAITEHYH